MIQKLLYCIIYIIIIDLDLRVLYERNLYYLCYSRLTSKYKKEIKKDNFLKYWVNKICIYILH